MASATRTPLTARELAAASVAQRGRLLEDARMQVERAATTRATAEQAVSASETAHVAALQASAAKASDDGLLDAVSRCAVRLQHARNILVDAVKSHEQATISVATAEAGVEQAVRAHERETLLAQLADGSHETFMREAGASIAKAVLDVQARVLAVRQRLTEDAAAVARVRELGGDAIAPDGLSAAAGFADGLRAAGGVLPGSDANALRWPFQTPAQPDPTGARAIVSLVGLAVASIDGATRTTYGRETLARVAKLWSRHRSYAPAASEARAQEQAAERARGAIADRAVNRRLSERQAEEHALARGRGYVPQSAPAKNRPEPALDEGEFVPEGAID